MKRILITAVFMLCGILSINAQEQNWFTNFDEAKALAAKENKVIIMVFQGSDWCVPCMKLEKEIWSTKEFKMYAAEHFVMLKLDFPRKKKNSLSTPQQEHNNKMAEKYNKKGFFPLVVILDKDGNELGRTGYKKMSTEEYIKHLESFKK